MNSRSIFPGALLALAGLFVYWFGRQADWTAMLLFALPPLVFGFLAGVRPRMAQFWAGVFALMWFAHGIMVAWSRPAERTLAWIEILLALAVIFSANWTALRARRSRKPG